MNAWSHLPNAHHIDWVIESLKKKSELWSATRDESWVAAWEAARDESWVAARDAVYETAWEAAWSAARGAASAGVHGDGSGGAILALVTYDDCDQYLQMTYEKLKMYAILSEKSQAVLLLPMKYVEERLNEQLKEPI